MNGKYALPVCVRFPYCVYVDQLIDTASFMSTLLHATETTTVVLQNTTIDRTTESVFYDHLSL